jgi:hypothetical protein
MYQIFQLKAEFHHVHLKYKKGEMLGSMSHNLTTSLWLSRIHTMLETGAPCLSLGFLREYGVASFVWRKETLIT